MLTYTLQYTDFNTKAHPLVVLFVLRVNSLSTIELASQYCS